VCRRIPFFFTSQPLELKKAPWVCVCALLDSLTFVILSKQIDGSLQLSISKKSRHYIYAYICMYTSFVIRRSSFVIPHSSFIIRHHHSSFIIHHSCVYICIYTRIYTPMYSSFILRHSSFIIHHSSSIIIHQSSFIIQRSSFNIPH